MSRKYNDDFINNLCNCYDNERDDNGDCPCKKKIKWLLILLLLLLSFFGKDIMFNDNTSKEEQYELDTKRAMKILEKNLINLNINDRKTAIFLMEKTNKSGGIDGVPVTLVKKDNGYYFINKNIYDDSVNIVGNNNNIEVVDIKENDKEKDTRTPIIIPEFNNYNNNNGNTNSTETPVDDNYKPLEGVEDGYATPVVPPYVPPIDDNNGEDNNGDNGEDNPSKPKPNEDVYEGYKEINFANQSVICKNFINGGCVSNTKSVKTYVSDSVNIVNSAYSPSFKAAHIDSDGDNKEDFVLVIHPSYVSEKGMLVEVNGNTTNLSSKDFYDLSSSSYNLVGVK
jgi:hypothetical protein